MDYNDPRSQYTQRDPVTIEELCEWYIANKLPPQDVTRFFIGVNYREPKAFGIYRRDDGRIEVFKNKADGTRAVRYLGYDEAYAVSEFITRLRQELDSQKARSRTQVSQKKTIKRLIAIALIVIIAVVLFTTFSKKSGYYYYNNDYYYYSHNTWFLYDTYHNDWYAVDDVYDDLNGDWRGDYYYDDTLPYGMESFYDSSTYTDYYEEKWANDDDSWDSNDSWDSGSTDWDSDW